MNRLEGKVALITGATKGIGEETAKVFAQEGASVVICGRDSASGEKIAAEINEQRADAAAFCKLDVTDYENWNAAIAFTQEKFGKLNILINNAGISFRETVAETTPDTWQKTLNTNQTGVFYGIKLGIEAMAKTGEPCAIVSTASIDGRVGDADFFSVLRYKSRCGGNDKMRCTLLRKSKTSDSCQCRGTGLYFNPHGRGRCTPERADIGRILRRIYCAPSHWSSGHTAGYCKSLSVSGK